jgi:hypothetical protein
MNKPKLIAIYKILDQKKDNLSKQTQVVEIFKVWDQALERSIRVNLSQSLIANLSEISTTFLRSFKERFLDKLIESLELELPSSDNRVEPLFLEIVFKMQLVYQKFQMHLERVLPLMQSDKATLSTFEALKVDIGDHISNRIQVFNEKILENIVKQS